MSIGVDPRRITDRGRSIYGPTPPGQSIPCARSTPLSNEEIAAVVDAIAVGREKRRSVFLPEDLRTRDWPSVMKVSLLLDERLGWTPAGWKIGAASEEVRRSEGLPGPAPGRIYRDTVFESPARLPAELFINYRNVECEFAFRLVEAVRYRGQAYTETEVAAQVECVMPVLEIGDTVFEDWYGASGYFGSCLDNGGGAALVCGDRIVDWRDMDLPNARMVLNLNGQYVKEGFGRAAMGHPLTALTWLVNWLRERGRGLTAGEIVSTGTCTGHCFVAAGDEVSIRFDGAGVVQARFET
jgi:2-keto-4-pentenoate hydratase